MRNSNQSYGGGRRFGGRDDRRSTMHRTTCSACGESCEVPFLPRGDKPVFCSNCFENRGGRDSGGRDNRRSFGGRDDRRSFGGGRDDDRSFGHKAVCSECGKECEVPFRPTAGKPVYCNDCFGNKSSHNKGGNNEQSKGQFDLLNAKLDKILHILAPGTVIEPTAKKEEKAKVKVVAEIKEVKPKEQTKEISKEMAKEEIKKPVAKKAVAKKTSTKKADPKKKK